MHKLFDKRYPADEVIEGKLAKPGAKRGLLNDLLNLVSPESCLCGYEQIKGHIEDACEELEGAPANTSIRKTLRLKLAREIATCINSFRSCCRFCLNKECERRDPNFPIEKVKEEKAKLD
jgi:hypothetical protein